MESLMEYLISKENKDKVSSGYTKRILKAGDIVEFRDKDMMMYVTENEITRLHLKVKPNAIKDANLHKGIFYQYNRSAAYDYYYASMIDYNENLTENTSAKNYDVIKVYPQQGDFDYSLTMSDLSVDNLRKLSLKRKMIKINEKSI